MHTRTTAQQIRLVRVWESSKEWGIVDAIRDYDKYNYYFYNSRTSLHLMLLEATRKSAVEVK